LPTSVGQHGFCRLTGCGSYRRTGDAHGQLPPR
jgi:hypothetical protein